MVALANGTGATIASQAYGPFGETDGTPASRFGYTGQQYLAPLGLYYYKARMYSPELGRFLQTDPVGYRDDLNWYAYVGNNPINFTDPTGMIAASGFASTSSTSTASANVPAPPSTNVGTKLDEPTFSMPIAAVGDKTAIQVAASTNNPRYAAKMLGYDYRTFGDMLHVLKPSVGLGPADNVMFHDNGDVYFKGEWKANIHDYSR
ncbi:hypothetical protein R69919_05491 [Paraburkholderia gardini]|nr:hypothetical protein R69919_05491 [Paraburkholderia gardini]